MESRNSRENNTELHYRKANKLKLYSCLIRYDAVWTYGGVEIWVPVIFNLGIRWPLLISFRPRPVYRRRRNIRCKLYMGPCGP